jgi:plasmid stabilization system protein ParE
MEEIKIFWSRSALHDVQMAIEYVVRERAQSASFLAQRIEQAVKMVARHPFIGRAGRVDHTRELVVAGTPLIIPYLIKSEGVFILAVLHAARRWPSRFKD